MSSGNLDFIGHYEDVQHKCFIYTWIKTLIKVVLFT